MKDWDKTLRATNTSFDFSYGVLDSTLWYVLEFGIFYQICSDLLWEKIEQLKISAMIFILFEDIDFLFTTV